MVSGGGLEPPRPLRALAPQASASAIPPPRRGDARGSWESLAARRNVSTGPEPKDQTGGRAAGRPAAYADRHEPPTTPPAPTTAPTAARPRTRSCGSARELIRIDSSNYGDGSGPGERAAAEYVMGQLDRGRARADLLESEPGRATVVVRLEGEDSHAARRSRCTATSTSCRPTPPTGRSTRSPREERDGCIWGRGAVDMKDMDAMILAEPPRTSPAPAPSPPRDTVFVVLRRRGGRRHATAATGSSTTTRSWFEGVTEAISEVGGYSVTVADAARASSAPTCCRPRRRASPGCGCAPTAGPATARCPTTRTPSCGSPRPSAGSPPTSGRASTSPRSASCSTG